MTKGLMMQEAANTIGDAIRAARKQKGLTLEYVAESMNPPVTKATVSAWETGRNRIKADTLNQICSILEVDASSLMPSDYVCPAVNMNDQLSIEIEELGNKYKMMSEKQRSAVLGVARAMVDC